MLGALERLEAGGRFDRGFSRRLALARLFAAATRERELYVADPRFAEVPVAELLSPDALDRKAEWAGSPDAAGEPPPPSAPRATGDTVAVVAADGQGNSISLIQSLFGSFGSGILCPATGIIFHNRGASFSLDPGSPNSIAGGKRPAHTLMPVMAKEDGETRFVNGTMGGLGQAQIHAQLLLELTGGAAPKDAVAAPRWVLGAAEVGGDGDSVFAESRLPGSVLGEFRSAGYNVVTLPGFDDEVGHAQSLRIDPDGSMAAGSDPRCDGLARSGRV